MGYSQQISLALDMNNLSLYMNKYVHMNNYSTETTVCRTQIDVYTIDSGWATKN